MQHFLTLKIAGCKTTETGLVPVNCFVTLTTNFLRQRLYFSISSVPAFQILVLNLKYLISLFRQAIYREFLPVGKEFLRNLSFLLANVNRRVSTGDSFYCRKLDFLLLWMPDNIFGKYSHSQLLSNISFLNLDRRISQLNEIKFINNNLLGEAHISPTQWTVLGY